MDKTLDAVEHCGRLSKKLIESFGDDDWETTPGTVGAAKEADTRNMLSEVLPAGMQVGTGFVIDTYGQTSRQHDIVIYEKDFCPRFRVSENAETAYYPCEGVIATGEIKSRLTAEQLSNACENIASVKRLKRNTEDSSTRHDLGYSVRAYGNKLSVVVPKPFSQKERSLDQIYSFVLAGKIKAQSQTLAKWLQYEVVQRDEELCPNLIVVGDEIVIQPCAWREFVQGANGDLSPLGLKPGLAVQDTRGYHLSKMRLEEKIGYTLDPHPLHILLYWLWYVWERGRTVPGEVMKRYFTWDGSGYVGFEGTFMHTKGG